MMILSWKTLLFPWFVQKYFSALRVECIVLRVWHFIFIVHKDQIFGIEVNYLALDADSREDSHPLSALPHATAEHAFDRMSYEKVSPR